VGQDFGVSRSRELRVSPWTEMNCDVRDGISSYGVNVNFVRLGSEDWRRACIRGEEHIDNIVISRNLGKVNGTNEDRLMLEKLDSKSGP
jgi:hypothetical protein